MQARSQPARRHDFLFDVERSALACADFIARLGLPVDDLFTHRLTFDEAVEAYQEFDQQSGGKGLFVSRPRLPLDHLGPRPRMQNPQAMLTERDVLGLFKDTD